jgi:23S rRNA pseudouridine1911/1915/1917 synthase
MDEVYKKVKIVYEDNHILVVIKPSGIPSQGDKTGDEDMLTILKEYIKEKYNKPGNVYLGLVHRLDRMTEGVMVFAKTSKAASRLSENIREGDFKKKYIALVEGIMEIGKKETLENYLLKNEKTNISRVVEKSDRDFKEAKLAKLEYTVRGNYEYMGEMFSYVDVKLYTGRHHQIRVQLSNIGRPIVGDVKYGKNTGKPLNKLGLYAYYLSFIHPTKDEYMEFELFPENIGIWKGIEKWS